MSYVYTLGEKVNVNRQLRVSIKDVFRYVAPSLLGTQRPSMLSNPLLHRAPLGKKRQVFTVPGINEKIHGITLKPSRANILVHQAFDQSIYPKKEIPTDFVKFNRNRVIATACSNTELGKVFKQTREKHKLRKFRQLKTNDQTFVEEPESMTKVITYGHHKDWYEKAAERNKKLYLEYRRQREFFRCEEKGVILKTVSHEIPACKPKVNRRWANVKSKINTFRI